MKKKKVALMKENFLICETDDKVWGRMGPIKGRHKLPTRPNMFAADIRQRHKDTDKDTNTHTKTKRQKRENSCQVVQTCLQMVQLEITLMGPAINVSHEVELFSSSVSQQCNREEKERQIKSL